MMATTPTTSGNNNIQMQRRMLYVAVGCICRDIGFQGASKACLETLTEMLQAHITELTRSCRKFCEHGHRTSPDLTDVKMALAEFGLSAHGLNLYSQRVKSQVLRKPNPSKLPAEHKTLKSSLPDVNQPNYIPNYLPGYPDMQSFVRTPTLREPVQKYDVVRERIATQRKSTENSLVKFLSKTKPSDVLIFEDIDTDKFPCVEVEFEKKANYLRALNYKVEVANAVDDLLDEKSDEEDTATENEGFSSPNKTEDENESKPTLLSANSTADTVNSSEDNNPYAKPPKRVRYKR